MKFMKQTIPIFLLTQILLQPAPLMALDDQAPADPNESDQLQISVDLYDHSEYMDCQDEAMDSYGEGWRFDEAESACRYQSTVQVSREGLPYRSEMGFFVIKLTKEGRASINYCYGDCDGGARAKVQFPTRSGRILFGDQPNNLSLSGGDYASGYWSISANVAIASIKTTDASE